MKKTLFIFFIFILLLFGSKLMAQPPDSGCMAPSSQVVYTFFDSRKSLYITPIDLSPECYSISDSGTPCKICPGDLNNPGNCKVTTISGTIVAFIIEDCPLDSSFFPLVVSLVGFGFFYVRKRNLLMG